MCVCVCQQVICSLCCSSDTTYCAVLEESLPHVGGETFVGIVRYVWGHDSVIDKGAEVCAHRGQVPAVRQPWLTMQLISCYAM